MLLCTSNFQVKLLVKHEVVGLEVTMGTVAVVHALDTADELAVVRHRGGGGGTEEEEEVSPSRG